MTWRFVALLLMSLCALGCAEATVRPFVDKSDAGADAGDEEAGDDDLDGGDDDGGDDDPDDLDGGEDDGGEDDDGG